MPGKVKYVNEQSLDDEKDVGVERKPREEFVVTTTRVKFLEQTVLWTTTNVRTENGENEAIGYSLAALVVDWS